MPANTRSRSRSNSSTSRPTSQQNFIPCPIPNCDELLPCKLPALVQEHLSKHHTSTEIRKVSPIFYEKAGVFKCPLCPAPRIHLTSSQNRLNSHINTKHTKSTRSATNTEIAITHFPPSIEIRDEIVSNWKRTFLYLHKLDPKPCRFRKSIYHKLKYSCKSELHDLAYKVYFMTSISNQRHVNSRNLHVPQSETQPSPLWKMTILFETALMAPPSGHECKGYANLMKKRISMFKKGQFDLLHKNAVAYAAKPSYDAPSEETRAKQLIQAANNDNWKKAGSFLKKPMPSVPYNEINLPKIAKLHPPPAPYAPTENIQKPTPDFHHHTFLASDETIRRRMKDEHLMIKTLRKMSRDTASGPQADSIDFLKDVFLKKAKTPNTPNNHHHNIKTLLNLLHLIYVGDLPKDIKDLLSYNESVSFYKKEGDPDAIRPIGIGIAWRRIATAHAVMVSKDHIASHLAPSQFAIGYNAGIEIITQTMQLQAERYLPTNPTTTIPPPRAILMLDLTNMFNSISMARAREIIFKRFPYLLPLFDTLYYNPTKCWYRSESGDRHHFLRMEGSSQGCPFAAMLACLVMHDVLTPIIDKLQQRAQLRRGDANRDDDGLGSMAITMTYIDDCTVSIHYEDISFFMDEFNKAGRQMGCTLKPQKCKVLTSLSGTSPMHILPPQHRYALSYVLDQYCGGQDAGEVTEGIRILGAPIGNTKFVHQYQTSKLQKLTSSVSTMLNLIPNDPHICTTLYKYSLQHYTWHLLPTNILHFKNESTQPKHYETEFITNVNNITKNFLTKMTSNPDGGSPTPAHSWCIATTPTGLGGLGFEDIAAKAIKCFITPLARTIRITQHGLIPQRVSTPNIEDDDPISVQLPPYITNSFRSWKNSNLRVFQTYRELTAQYTSNLDSSICQDLQEMPLQNYTLHTSLKTTNSNIQKYIYIQRMKSIWPSLPRNVKKHLPSCMSLLTSLPLSTISRTDASNRFSDVEFRAYAQRKLRLPLWPPVPTKCRCGQTIDEFGDHFFTCPKASKIELHNRMRDSVYTICQNIFPIISQSTTQDTLLEHPHLFDQAPHMRPGDVVVRHPLHTNVEPHSNTLIDINMIPPCKSTSETLSYAEIIKDMNTHHKQHEYKKFKLKHNKTSNATADQLAQESITKRYRHLPFTIDHQGMLGPLAAEFLFSQQTTLFKTNDIEYETSQTSTQIKKLISFSLHPKRHKNILKRANKNWHSSFGDKWYTNTYHAKTPAQWAKQVLGTTFSLESSRHIIRAMIASSRPQTSTPKTKIQCCSMNLHTPTKYAARSIQHLLAT